MKPQLSEHGYAQFTVRLPVRYEAGTRKSLRVMTHRLVAYQKYGDAMFAPGIVVRHRDGNPLNNHADNILIGTQSDNMMDMPQATRKRTAIAATTKNRVLTDEQVRALKEDRFVHGLTYQQLSDKYEIGNKGHAYYIANHEYVSSKT